MGVTPTTIQQWENGDTSPRGHRLRKLAEELGVDEFYLSASDEDVAKALASNTRAAAEWVFKSPAGLAAAVGVDVNVIAHAMETGELSESVQHAIERICRLTPGALASPFTTFSRVYNTTDPSHPLNGVPQERVAKPKQPAPHPTSSDDLSQNDPASLNSPIELSAGPAITRWVPVISWNQAAMWSETTDMDEPGYAEERLPFVQEDEKSFALRVQGDAMTAPSGLTYPEGCLIVVDPTRRQPASGERVIARLGDGSLAFRVFMEEAGRRWLRALNQGYPPHTDTFQVLGTVTWTFRRE
jgi:SOS-response transcriptional repressor LexA